MTHELIHIVRQAWANQKAGLKNVLATVVALDGSSYRKPGVRMLICENGESVGAVSGGCVEKEVMQAAQTVFQSGQARVITYDGRFRLGCEGTLYMLLEPISLSEKMCLSMEEAVAKRTHFALSATFKSEHGATGNFGSTIHLGQQKFSFNDQQTANGQQRAGQTEADLENNSEAEKFEQSFPPLFKLLVIGGEHDTEKLTALSNQLGWEVEVITSLNSKRDNFPGATKVLRSDPQSFDSSLIDQYTAVVLMTHSYSTDLKYLLQLVDTQPAYIGILGAVQRRERLFDELLNYKPMLEEEFLQSIHSPAGLNIGAESPEEIALSILAEILAVVRKRQPHQLREIKGSIHKKLAI